MMMETATTTTTTTTAITSTNVSPRFHLVIANIQKRVNVSALMKTALAFGCRSILLVGQAKNSDEDRHRPLMSKAVADVLAQSSSEKNNEKPRNPVQLLKFAKWRECLEWLTTNRVCLIGVEIDEDSLILNDEFELPMITSAVIKGPDDIETTTTATAESSHPSFDDFAILMGNEGQGIHPKHLQACQSTIRIPQYGTGTASFNVNVAASIALYHLQNWKHKRLKNSNNQQK